MQPVKRFSLSPEVIGRKLLHWWAKRNPYTRTLPLYLWRAITNFFQDGMRGAAALAFYTILSIFPLTLLVAVGVSRLLGPAVAQEQIANGLSLFLPGETVNLLQGNLIDALQQGRSFGLVAIGGLVWAATGLFSNITFSLDLIFQVPSNRSLWRQRVIAAFMAIMLIMLVAASFLTAGVLRLAQTVLLNQPNIWLTISTYFLPIGLNMVIFAMLFRYVPARHVFWDAVWPAAIFGALGWELARWGFGLYLTNIANYQFVYGGIATVIVLQLWAYLIAAVFLFSAELCARLNEWFQSNYEERRKERHQILFEDRRRSPKLPKAS
jgi:membrane protein